MLPGPPSKRYCFLILFLIKLFLFLAALCLGPSVGVLVWKVSLGTYFLFFMFLLFSLFFFLINLNMANISAYLCGNFPRGSNSWGCSVECFLDLPPNATVFLYFSLLNSSFSLLPCASAHLWGFLCGKFPWGPIFYFSRFYMFIYFSLFVFNCVFLYCFFSFFCVCIYCYLFF